MQRVWVRMSAGTSRTHGACLRMHILSPGNPTIPRSLHDLGLPDGAPGFGRYPRHSQSPGPEGTGIGSQRPRAPASAEGMHVAGMHESGGPGGTTGSCIRMGGPRGAGGGLQGTTGREGAAEWKGHGESFLGSKSAMVHVLEGFEAGWDGRDSEEVGLATRDDEVYLQVGAREQEVDAREEYGEESWEVVAWRKMAEAGRWAVLAERCGPCGDPAKHASCVGLAQGLMQEARSLQGGEGVVA